MNKHICKAKRVDNGEWVEGFYCKSIPEETQHFIFPEFLYNCYEMDDSKGSYSLRVERYYEVDPNTVCSYVDNINQDDKLHVFEGDVIKARKHDPYEGKPLLDSIRHRNGTYYVGNYTWSEFKNIYRGVEVIGNIHD